LRATIYGEVAQRRTTGAGQFPPKSLSNAALERLAGLAAARDAPRQSSPPFGNAKLAERSEVSADDVQPGRRSSRRPEDRPFSSRR